jgi:hypothetical protein
LKKIISILILTFFIYNTFGFLVVHPFLSIYYKSLGLNKAEFPSEKELIERLVFNKEDISSRKINFIWIHSREFKYNGDMYDIVKKEESDEHFILYCINDTKEKKLEEEFEKNLHKSSKEDKNRSSAGNYNISIISEPAKSEQISIDSSYECGCVSWSTGLYKSLLLDIPSPPPRSV